MKSVTLFLVLFVGFGSIPVIADDEPANTDVHLFEDLNENTLSDTTEEHPPAEVAEQKVDEEDIPTPPEVVWYNVEEVPPTEP